MKDFSNSKPSHPEMNGRLHGKLVVIVGDFSDKSHYLATSLAERGANIALVCEQETPPTRMAQVQSDVEERGKECLLLTGDVSSTAFAEDVVHQVMDRFGRMDVFVHLSAPTKPQGEDTESLVVNPAVMSTALPYLVAHS